MAGSDLERQRALLADRIRGSRDLPPREESLLLQLLASSRAPHRELVAVNLPYNARNRIIRLLGRWGGDLPIICLSVLDELLIDDLLTIRTTAEAMVPACREQFHLAAPLLERMARHEYPGAREAVAATVLEGGGGQPDQASRVLRAWARSSSRDVREVAARGLTSLGPRLDRAVVPSLLRLSEDEFSVVRSWATLGLGPHLLPRDGAVLEALHKRSLDVRWSVRIRVAQTLARTPASCLDEVLPLLARLSMDLIPGVSQEAMSGLRALARTRPHACLETLGGLARDGSLIDVDALLLLIRALREVGAAEPEEAIRLLRRLTHDPDPAVRRRAHKAIKNLRRAR